jgi:hypothetical protein
MELDSIQDSTRYVVSGVHHGSILPGKRTEMNRNVFLLSHANINGGVWANDLTLSGADIIVEQSVYSSGSITIEEPEQIQSHSQNKESEWAPVTFGSCVVAADSIMSKAKNLRVRFKSDIYTKRLNLSNAIVYGNIFAENAVIKDSIILGCVFCKNKLDLKNSMVSTFKTHSVKLIGNLFLFFPFAFSETPINIQEPIKALTFFNIYKSLNKNAFGDNDGIGDGIILFDQDDIFEIQSEDSNSTDSTENDNGCGTNAYVLSGNERILDAVRITQHLKYNQQFLENLTLGNHLLPRLKSNQFDRPAKELECYLWNILHPGQKFNTVSGTSKIQDMFKRSDLKEFMGDDVK